MTNDNGSQGNKDLYQDGEEKFGFFLSGIYSFFAPLGKRRYKNIVEDLGQRDVKKLLDIGCGPGVLEQLLAERFYNARIYGIDPSPHMVSNARKRMKKKKLESKVQIELGSNREIPITEKFDTIITSFSYHHWKDGNSSIPSLIKFLTDDGEIIIYEHDMDNSGRWGGHGASESQWKNLDFPGLKKTIDHTKDMIILRLSRERS